VKLRTKLKKMEFDKGSAAIATKGASEHIAAIREELNAAKEKLAVMKAAAAAKAHSQ